MLTKRLAFQKTAARSYKKKLKNSKCKYKKSHIFFKAAPMVFPDQIEKF